MKLSQLILILTLLLFSRLQIAFLNYLNFLETKEFRAKVVNQYKKRNYWVLKLKNRDFTFYTTSREYLKNLLNETLSFRFVKKIGFFEYLGVFYAPIYNLKLIPISKIEYFIEKQHKKLKNFFKALFLGESIEFSVRKKLSTLGVSHLFALSGLHLGIISFALYFIFYPIYSLFHNLFPYRNRFFDLGVLILGIEFLYLYFTNFPPSLIRAFVLEVVLFFLAIRFENIFRFYILAIVIFVSLFIFLDKIVSIGFLLSIVGVFYIYLFFNYFKLNFKNGIILSFYMYVVMFAWSHYFFGEFNNYQLLSPIISILFTLFYPLEAILHLFNFGWAFDGVIEKYLKLGENYWIVKINFWFILIYFILSLIAVRKKWAFYGINLIGVVLIVASIRV